MYSLNPSLADLHTVVLAGPGVVRQGQTTALQAFAAQAGVGVLNTWGAKGVFRWDSPHHLGTGGLQERDFELAGLPDAELLIAVGIDEDESARARFEHGHVLDVQPESLAALAFGWPPPTRTPERPALYRELSAALASHYTSDDVPLRPARAAGDLAAALPAGALVAADPGPAGLWVARAFPTTEPGSVVVPATVAPGFAVAAAFVAALDGRPAVAVTTDPIDRESELLLDLARALDVPIVVEVWGADAPLSTPADRVGQLVSALQDPAGVDVRAVPVDFGHTRTLVEVAGPVVAWGADGAEAGG
jgi:thiamine pyrophosphate-dependent acetolactate synthase large subunit-like protein